MGRSLLKYLIAFTFLSFSGIVILDYFILPNYVGYNNEHYLPDVRGEYLEKATYQLRSLGFNTHSIRIPFLESHTPGTVIKMFPRAFTKVKEGRTID
jgi:beta-lactam-binding protein with PASTA domain